MSSQLSIPRSICAPNSIKPLKVTDEAMKTILDHHHVGPQFLDLLLSFATGNKESEACTGSMTTKNNPDGSYGEPFILLQHLNV
jgi:N-acetylglucosamine-6-phosphate deacetylase